MAPAAERGFRALYHDGETNHCPGCGRTQWLIGRVTAECAFCETAILLDGARPAERPVVAHWSTRPGVGPLE